MSDSTNPNPNESQATPPPAEGQQTAPNGHSPAAEAPNPELEALRAAAAKLEAELNGYKEAERKAKEAEMSEVERLRLQLAEKEAAARSAAIRLEALKAGVQSPELIEKLIAADAPTEKLADAVADLTKKYPYLVGGAGGGTPGSPARNSHDPLLQSPDGKPLVLSLSDPRLWKKN